MTDVCTQRSRTSRFYICSVTEMQTARIIEVGLDKNRCVFPLKGKILQSCIRRTSLTKIRGSAHRQYKYISPIHPWAQSLFRSPVIPASRLCGRDGVRSASGIRGRRGTASNGCKIATGRWASLLYGRPLLKSLYIGSGRRCCPLTLAQYCSSSSSSCCRVVRRTPSGRSVGRPSVRSPTSPSIRMRLTACFAETPAIRRQAQCNAIILDVALWENMQFRLVAARCGAASIRTVTGRGDVNIG